jgi:hypothetical protein
MDVYSCKDFSVDSVVEFVKSTMDIIHGGFVLIDRNDSSPSVQQCGIF